MMGREGGLGGRSNPLFGFLKKKTKTKRVEPRNMRVHMKQIRKSKLNIAVIVAQKAMIEEGNALKPFI